MTMAPCTMTNAFWHTPDYPLLILKQDTSPWQKEMPALFIMVKSIIYRN